MFVAAIDPGASAVGADDWRKDKDLVQRFKPFEALPETVRNRIFNLLDRIGLNFATIDMI